MKAGLTQSVVIVFSAREGRDAAAGGIHKAVLAQIAALQANGIHVHLLTASLSCAASACAMGATVDCSDVWHNAIKPLLFPKYWIKLLRLRMRGPACVIHHNGRTWAWAGLFFAGIANVQILHREIVRPYRFFRRWVALSPGYADYLCEHHSVWGWRRIAWAPNSLISDPPQIPAVEPRREDYPFKLGYIGRSGKGKGTDLLVRSLATLVARGHDVVLCFAGEEDLGAFANAEALGVGDRITFTGWHSDLAPFIDSIDLLVLPSLKESFGLVLIEAMVRAKPALVTACNGPASIVTDGESGYVVPIGDADALATGLERAITDPSLREKGEIARGHVLLRYTPGPAGVALIAALRQLGADFPKP